MKDSYLDDKKELKYRPITEIIDRMVEEELRQSDYYEKHRAIVCHCCDNIIASGEGHEVTLESTRSTGRYVKTISYQTKVCDDCYKFFKILTRIKIALVIICSIISPIAYHKLDGTDMRFWIIVGYIAIGAVAGLIISMPIEQIYKVIVGIFFKRSMFANWYTH